MSRYGLTSTVAYGMCSVNNGGMLAKYYAVELAESITDYPTQRTLDSINLAFQLK